MTQISPVGESICQCEEIFAAVQEYSGKALIKPAVIDVFPTFRECPPTTRVVIGL
jgi:hypothetical protein